MRRRHCFLLGLLVLGSVTPLVPQADLDSYKGCGLRGTAQSKCGKALNVLKNRYTSPTAADINTGITLQSIVATGDDLHRWSNSDGAVIEGYVASVEPGGNQESCNCGKTSLRDIHINVVPSLAEVDNPTRYVVVEITPRMKALHPAWTYEWAEKLEGKRVRFTGWMLFDGMHSRESFNTKHHAHQGCGTLEVHEIWRATAWEVHPVTAIKVL